MFVLEERRVRRSQHRDLALGFQLEHVKDQGRLEALVLADDDGLALSTAGDPGVCRELAAIAPLMAKSILGIPLPPLLRGAEVAVRLVHVHGQALYLASVGGGVARDALLAHSLAGVKRILSCN
ncbi:MAG TPA: hypothetical protein RMH99_03535 [Sandaracinaceae bacterium LLY-WYZ-13_1]|nr:hypothetical protein [Sandaracinaceae bacterium LLY-WYZ-13_1]